ncbi:hypothetical protein D3C86_1623540 [compost metagenome]
MPAEAVAEQCREVAVVHLTRFGGAILTAEKTAQVAGEHTVAKRQVVQQRQGVLLVQLGHLGMVGAQTEFFVDLIIAPHVRQMRGGGGAVESPVWRGDAHGLIVRGIALVDAIDVAGVEGQAIDIFGTESRAAKGLWQQSRWAGESERQENRDIAALHLGLGKS